MSAVSARRQSPAPRTYGRDLGGILLPTQVFGGPQPLLGRSASARLMHAVLEQAVADLETPDGPRPWQQQAYRDAYWWVTSADVTHYFSFLNLCETLGYHAASVRAALLRHAPPPAAAG